MVRVGGLLVRDTPTATLLLKPAPQKKRWRPQDVGDQLAAWSVTKEG